MTALLPEPWVVRGVTRETSDVVTLEIEPRAGAPTVIPQPGQFQMLYAFGVGEVPISIAGVTPPGRLLHTIRDVGATTHALCHLGLGDTVGVRGPFGSTWPVSEARGRDVLIAAGGIGIAPLRPILEAILEDRKRFASVVVLYGARQAGDLLYEREFAAWRRAGIQVEVTVDHGDHTWGGHVGVVTTLIRHAAYRPDQATAFLCGPEIMMLFMARELIARGVPPEHTHLTMERNMKCAVGFCGHCQLGPEFICLDGPVFPWPRIEPLLSVPEL